MSVFNVCVRLHTDLTRLSVSHTFDDYDDSIAHSAREMNGVKTNGNLTRQMYFLCISGKSGIPLERYISTIGVKNRCQCW